MTTLRIQLPTFRTAAPRGAEPLARAAYALWYFFDLMVSARKPNAWAEQFSAASLAEPEARSNVDALYRGGSVRL
jgi:hypothetical protein